LFPPSDPSGVCDNFSDGSTDAFLVHCGEGVDAAALEEWTDLSTAGTPNGCLLSYQTTVTHGVAFTNTEFAAMAAAKMKLTWSPASNIALYGRTTNIPAALSAGITVALGPDWSMGGSQNLLDELRFADNWDNTHWGDNISAEELVHMVTKNAAAVLGLESVLGKLEVGLKADILVIGGDTSRPFDSVVAARPRDVRLVMVGGKVLFGDDQLEAAGPVNPGCETFDACGRNKFLCVAEASTSNLFSQTKDQIEKNLNDALQDLDGIAALPNTDCGSCPTGESCYVRTSVPMANASQCASACASGQACFQTSASGYGCLSINACEPTKTEAFYPVAPLLKCN
ncbi:MAG: amidohydrolase family protein, partial [Myxococcales bacterium]|nr:amidohydrolase family protein [Myxococcales bacterium]